MKFSKLSQLFMAAGIGLIVATLLSACSLVTIDYVFVGGHSGIQVFAADSQSGALRPVAGTDKTPFSAGGTPVSFAVTPDYANLYAATSDSKTIVHFAIDNTGKLTQKDKITLAATPVAIAVDQAGKVLYAVSGTTTAVLQSYSLSAGAIGSMVAQQTLQIPGYGSDQVAPTALWVLTDNKGVFATVTDISAYNPGGIVTSNAHPGWVFGFTTDTGGSLTASTGSPFQAGVRPSGVVADPTNTYLYVTDFASNQMIGYTISSTNSIQFLVSGPYKTGSQPTGIAVDPRGHFLYVSNGLDSSVTAYQIDLATGVPSQSINSTGSQTNSTDTQPVAVTVDPALGRFVYTANSLGNSVSGFRLNSTNGTLERTQSTPYPSVQAASCLIAIPHGNHSVQTVTP